MKCAPDCVIVASATMRRPPFFPSGRPEREFLAPFALHHSVTTPDPNRLHPRSASFISPAARFLGTLRVFRTRRACVRRLYNFGVFHNVFRFARAFALRCCARSPNRATPLQPRSSPAPFRWRWKVATCWRAPRPAPARPPRSRCRCCNGCPGRRAARTPARRPRALVLTPTRELAAQVHDSLRDYAKHLRLSSVAIFGGVGMGPQMHALQAVASSLVATPGRLIDHMERRTTDLSGIEILVLDEADRMLDMGFLPALKRILSALPKQRQTCCSRPLSPEIKMLAMQFMRDPRSLGAPRATAWPPRSAIECIRSRLGASAICCCTC